jgi:hypothetical protein
MREWVVAARHNIVLFVLAITTVLGGCSSSSRCGETVLQSASTPSGETTAKVIKVNCGATSAFFTYVSIQTSRVKLRDDGILFGYKGTPEIKIFWSGERSLRIECLQCEEAKVYRRVAKEEQYQVVYSTDSSPEQ